MIKGIFSNDRNGHERSKLVMAAYMVALAIDFVAMMTFLIVLFTLLFVGLETPWGELNLDIFPTPRIWVMK